MPFKSKAQQRFMYATKPKGVDLKEMADKTDFSKLPEKAKKKKKAMKEAACGKSHGKKKSKLTAKAKRIKKKMNV